jgi:hypothetical protein
MTVNVKSLFLYIIAVFSGLIILAGYFVKIPVLINLRSQLLNWAIILLGVALLIGVVNLTLVHARKIIRGKSGFFFSIVLLIGLFTTLIVGFVYGPTSQWSLWIFNQIQVPIETSLVALLAVILILAAIRLLRRKPDGISMVFIFTILIVLLGTITLPWIDFSLLGEVRGWLFRVPVLGGARGILIGIVLGIIATGLRVLIGSDRPYED